MRCRCNRHAVLLSEIRIALLQAYAMRYGSPDFVTNKEEVFFNREEGDPQVRGLLYHPNRSKGLVPAIVRI